MMEYGPLLVISFQQYATQALRNRDGKVIEGDPVSQTQEKLILLNMWL